MMQRFYFFKGRNMNSYNQVSDPIRTFFTQVFAWMSVGLAVTATTAWYIFYQQPQIMVHLVQSPVLLIGIFLVQLALVFWLSSSLYSRFAIPHAATSLRTSFGAALTAFLVYAALNGVVFSGIFFTYTQESIALTFGIAAAMFFVMAVFGYITRIDLTPIGVFGYMALWGLIIAMLVNWYFQSSMLELVISAIGVVLFSALTAYDMQQLSLFAAQLQNGRGQDVLYQMALMGALRLYLDFINLFVMLLSFTGKRRD
jgi:FtsH-binding integral membrane protein